MRGALLIAMVVALLATGAVVGAFLFLTDLPPAPVVQLPSEAYKEARLQSKIEQLTSLAARLGTTSEIEQQKQCEAAVAAIIGSSASPEDLALLAIWAERQEPWLTSNCVYRTIFFGDINKLAELRGDKRAEYGLWKIRESLFHQRRWDGHVSEAVEEAQQKQQSSK